jgi:hypothetical protein
LFPADILVLLPPTALAAASAGLVHWTVCRSRRVAAFSASPDDGGFAVVRDPPVPAAPETGSNQRFIGAPGRIAAFHAFPGSHCPLLTLNGITLFPFYINRSRLFPLCSSFPALSERIPGSPFFQGLPVCVQRITAETRQTI